MKIKSVNNPQRCRIVPAATIVTAIILLMIGQSNASFVEKKNLRELVQEADAIVEGTISKFNVKKQRDGNIVTRIILGDLVVLDGTYKRKNLKLMFWGGTLETGETHYIVGAPKFEIGERVILFVKGNGSREIPIVGITQGVFRIHTNENSGRSVIKTCSGLVVDGIMDDRIYTRRTKTSNSYNNHGIKAFGGYTEEGEEVKEVGSSESAEIIEDNDIGITQESFVNKIRQMASSISKENDDLFSVENFEGFMFKEKRKDLAPPLHMYEKNKP